jgi:hypothetical protein
VLTAGPHPERARDRVVADDRPAIGRVAWRASAAADEPGSDAVGEQARQVAEVTGVDAALARSRCIGLRELGLGRWSCTVTAELNRSRSDEETNQGDPLDAGPCVLCTAEQSLARGIAEH